MEKLRKIWNFWGRLKKLAIPMRAAFAGYFIILSVFPALLLLLTMVRFTGIEVESLAELVCSLLPGAFHTWAEELVYVTWQNATGAVAGVSAIFALWSASRGVYGLYTGLNAVYEVEESRGYLLTRLLCTVYALAFLVVLVLTLTLHVFGTGLMKLLLTVDNPVVIFLTDILNSRWIALPLVQAGVFTLMYWVLPNRKARLRDCLPGGIFSAVGWLVFSDLYSVYTQHFPAYANVYGSVYAIALCMVWLYCCMSILLYGGVLNRLLEEHRKKKYPAE